MNRVKFDKPRKNEMQDFLMRLYTISIQNPDLTMNSSIIYHELCRYGLTSNELDSLGKQLACNDLFDSWHKRNIEVGNQKKGMGAYCSPTRKNFFQFFNLNSYYEFHATKSGYIKIYVPLKKQNLYEDVNKLFDYLCNSGIKHLSKVAAFMRSDNVVIRLSKNDLESAIKIIKFINNNYDTKSIGVTNPFVPTVDGVGFSFDYGGSYNTEMSKIISKYINECTKKKKIPDLKEFFQYANNNSFSREVLLTLPYVTGEKNSVKEEKEKNVDDKLLTNALTATYNKYGIKHTIESLMHILLFNDYNMITNDDSNLYRVKLMNTSRDKLNQMISNILNINSTSFDRKEIVLLCYKLFGTNLYSIISQVCAKTYDKYGYDHLKIALNNLCHNNSYQGFTRSSLDENDIVNYRGIISRIPPNVILDIIKLSMGIDIYQETDLNILFDSFINKSILPLSSKTKSM